MWGIWSVVAIYLAAQITLGLHLLHCVYRSLQTTTATPRPGEPGSRGSVVI